MFSIKHEMKELWCRARLIDGVIIQNKDKICQNKFQFSFVFQEGCSVIDQMFVIFPTWKTSVFALLLPTSRELIIALQTL